MADSFLPAGCVWLADIGQPPASWVRHGSVSPQPDELTREAGPDELTREAGPGELTREAGPDELTREAGPGELTREAGPDELTEAGPDELTREAGPARRTTTPSGTFPAVGMRRPGLGSKGLDAPPIGVETYTRRGNGS
ncbi:hypothetical protein GCM10010170_065830 [Dactylosporangium salmoneum]|uniref:Uncharacterized protein n=1 Tax=Dactylosporangium salmoneum TaxID=53361 RepID=A0ABP5U402_9ACTN